MVRIETLHAHVRSPPRSRSPHGRNPGRDTNSILASTFLARYHWWNLNIYVPRPISSFSVTKGFLCTYGKATTWVIGISSVSLAACSRVNPVSCMNSISCWSSSLGTRRGSSSFCCVPSLLTFLIFFGGPLSACGRSLREVFWSWWVVHACVDLCCYF